MTKDKHRNNVYVRALRNWLRYSEKEECLYTWRGIIENSREIWKRDKARSQETK